MTRQKILLVCPENLDRREFKIADELAAQADLVVVVPHPETAGRKWNRSDILSLAALASFPASSLDFVLYASAPALDLHWKVWRWKRFKASNALLGGYWPKVTESGAFPDKTLSGRMAFRTLDFFLTADETGLLSLERKGVHGSRVLVSGESVTAKETVAFLLRRRASENHSILWVDEDLSLNSPSTKHLVYSLPHLQEQGWEVRAWCLTSDVSPGAVETQLLPKPPGVLRVLTPYWFSALANGYGLVRRLLDGRPPARIVQTVGGAYLGADIAAIHFVNHAWLLKQLDIGLHTLKAFLMFLATLLGVIKDQLQFSNPRCRLFLPVSDSIAVEVRQRCLPRAEVKVLPNSYDEIRFNPAVRQQWREPTRHELGFGPTETVFCFASQGHHQRKGFWLAVEALAQLRRSDSPKALGVKFLVIGGQPTTLSRLQDHLSDLYPDWESWLVFVGNKLTVERYLAAADAFLLPSYFEAFCLAEIEAGALGLPLLLTRHPGTEMILRPGDNGLLLPFDPAGIKDVLAQFLMGALPRFKPSTGRALDRQQYASEIESIYREYVGSGISAATSNL